MRRGILFLSAPVQLCHPTLLILTLPTPVLLLNVHHLLVPLLFADSWEEEYMSHFTLSRHMSWSCSRVTAVVQVSREPRHPSTRADCRCRSNDLRAPRSTETVHTTPTRQSSVCCYRSCLS
ncbi:hypothetical protein J6590_060668 [Homalodisca vitripennis]|nr:hypothetical protein J6590_060668 [Homalodisca vitripennis]